MRPRGVTTKRWAGWRLQERHAVLARAGGRCEFDATAWAQEGWITRCPREGVHIHHCFGRRNVIGEPLASHRTMTTWLCEQHHNAAHAHRHTLGILRLVALARAWSEWPGLDEFEAAVIVADQAGAARCLERTLRLAGVDPMQRTRAPA